jgi:hypothetical protein
VKIQMVKTRVIFLKEPKCNFINVVYIITCLQNAVVVDCPKLTIVASRGSLFL